jgi:YfiR/HmsC-like
MNLKVHLPHSSGPTGGWSAVARLLALGVLLLHIGGVMAAEAMALEYKVKAGFLYNFAKFVEWPARVFPATNSPIIIGVMDANEALPIIQQVLAQKMVKERPIQVKAVTTPESAAGCHILFVSRAAAASPEELRAALASAATLLVGEAEAFAERGGAIGFVREADAIRFQLNLESTTNTQLKISAKLASVAKLVKTQRPQ